MTLIPRNIKSLAVMLLSGITFLGVCEVSHATNEAVDLFRQRRVLNAAQRFLEEGKRELESGVYVRAIRVLSQAITKGADPEAFKLRGQAYEALGESSKALSDFSAYIGARASDPEGYLLRGDAYLDHRDYEKALPDFARAVELDPSFAEVYLGRGIAHLGLEEYELAVKEFRLAAQHDSANAEALTNIGLAYMLSNRPDEATDFFKKALERENDPKWKQRIASWVNDPTGSLDWAALTSDSKGSASAEEAAIAAEPAMPERSSPRSRLARRPAAGPLPGREALSGSWEGVYMGSKLKMQFQQSGQKISGTVRVRPPGAAENVFSFTGTFEQGKVLVSHVSGSNFKGMLTDDRRLVGVLTTPDGARIPIDLPEQQ